MEVNYWNFSTELDIGMTFHESRILCLVKETLGWKMKKICGFVFFGILIEVVPTLSFSSAKYVWPLTDSTYTYEIKNSKAGDYTQCGFHFAGNHPSFAGPPLQLNGYTYPYIDIDIDNSNEFKSFSFALSVNIAGSVGCIFHFKSTTTGSNVITDVSVCVNGTSLQMEVTSSTGVSTASLSPSTFQGQWFVVQAGRNFDNTEMKFMSSYSGDTALVSDIHGSKILGLPGTFRIGAKHDMTMALSLEVTCFTMYDVTTNAASAVTDIESQCKSPPSVSGLPTPSAGCPVADTTQPPSATTAATSQCTRTSSAFPNQRNGFFILTVKDKTYSDPANLIATFSVFNIRHCAELCLRYNQCFSFLLKRMDVELSNCTLFKTRSPSNSGPLLSSNLYAVKCQ
ncbi:uncharacterized protein LOC134251565 [Saccostrea cucullata]|uniref:uncharacterized protein LOC134251565 n=1 Tax=Saccostrea cuccullata TaxID=36930 RepID=UPI002ED215AC